MTPKNFEEQIFFATTKITIPEESGTGASIGTGFLMRVPLNDELNRTITLLISNKHVFVNPKEKITFTFNKKDAEGGADLGEIHTFNADSFHAIYSEHPDSNIDLACINASVISNTDAYYRYLLPEMIADFTEESLVPGLDVWFIGYRFDVVNNLPLLRRGYISSIPKIDFNAKKQFVIDAQVFLGSSGSPVFAQLNNEFKLIGIVTETMIKHGQLQAIPTLTSLGVQQTLGLGIVIKATLLKELIDVTVTKVKIALKSKDEPTTEEK
jgi:hypothetical protein